MTLNTYLVFNGNCKEAFEFYATLLGGKIESMFTHAGSPMEAQTPANWLDKIMHAHLSVGGSQLMGSDAPPDRYKTPHAFAVNIGLTTLPTPNASSTRSPKTARSACPSNRPSGPPASVWLPTASGYPG